MPKNEIARRIGISRRWVRNIAARPGGAAVLQDVGLRLSHGQTVTADELRQWLLDDGVIQRRGRKPKAVPK